LFATAAAPLPPPGCPRLARGRLTLFATGLPAPVLSEERNNPPSKSGAFGPGVGRPSFRSEERNDPTEQVGGIRVCEWWDGIGHVARLQIGRKRDENRPGLFWSAFNTEARRARRSGSSLAGTLGAGKCPKRISIFLPSIFLPAVGNGFKSVLLCLRPQPAPGSMGRRPVANRGEFLIPGSQTEGPSAAAPVTEGRIPDGLRGLWPRRRPAAGPPPVPRAMLAGPVLIQA